MTLLQRFISAVSLFLALQTACMLLTAAADGLPSDWRTGIATNYGQGSPYSPSFGTQDGSCGYGVLDKDKYPFWSVGALATGSLFYGEGPVQGCGMCFEVECIDSGGQFAGRCNSDSNSRSATIMITDSCPECQSDQLDIQALTFAKLAPMYLGRVDIRYRRVECIVPTGMSVYIDSNAGNGGWVRLEVKQVAGRGAVKTVQVKGSDSSSWQTLNNIWGAAWETSYVPKPPLDFRIQDDTGVEVTALGVVQADGQTGELPMGVNFQVSGGASKSMASSSGSSSSSSFPGSSSSSSSSSSSYSPSPSPPPPPSSSGSSGSSSSQKVSAFEGPPQGSPASGSSPCVSAYAGANSGSSTDCGGHASSSTSTSPPTPWWDSPPPPSPYSPGAGGGRKLQQPPAAWWDSPPPPSPSPPPPPPPPPPPQQNNQG